MARRAFLVFALLAALHTWPLAAAPHRLSLNHNADAQLNAWIVSWIAHALPADPARFWEGNIFQPGERALTFSEPLLVPALIGAPIAWLGGSAVVVFNVLLLTGLALTATVTSEVVRRWSGSTWAGLAAGAFFAFNTHLLTRLPHLQAAHAWGLFLVWGAAWDRLHGAGRWWWLPAAVALTAATSLHWLVFAAMGASLMALTGRHEIRASGRVALEGLAGIVVALPILWPHVTGGVTRTLDQVAQFSATPLGWVTAQSHLHRTWTAGWFRVETDLWFPGIVVLVLAAVGLAGARRTPLARWAIAMVAVGVTLSLGTSTPVYEWAYRAFPPMQGIRAATRFGMLAYGGLAVLMALGLVRLLSQWHPTRLRWAGLAVVAALTAEHLHAPIRTTPFAGVPPVYTLLRDEPGPVLLAEMPFYPPEAVFENGEYVLNATGHWRPVMNGYSGLTPMSYRGYSERLWFFPEPRAFAGLEEAGATHVMVHLERFGPQAGEVAESLNRRPDLRLLAADREGHRLYRIVRE